MTLTDEPKTAQSYCRELRNHVAISERSPEQAQFSLAAIESFESVMGKKELLENALLTIVSAARSPHLGPCMIGNELLLALLADFPEIETVWRSLAKSKQAHERWVAISVARDDRFPFLLAQEFAQTAIRDRSAKVRLFGVEAILIRCIDSLLPELKELARTEKNPKVIESIDWVVEHM